jgi:prepilin-type N-terminal cleavage/methylation domain-containing protein
VRTDSEKKMKKKAGFTIIELAVVMIIIGILIGVVIKGGALIDNARMKKLYALKNDISQATYGYYEQYSYYPGDDPNMLAKWPTLPIANGNGNGVIANGIAASAPIVCAAGAVEQCSFWSALRQAGFLTGTGFTNPRHPYGNMISVTFYNDPSWGAANALITHWIIFMSVPGGNGQAFDLQYDDGNWQTGTIRGSAAYTASSINLYFQL